MTHFLKEPCSNNVPFPPTSMRSCLGKLFRSYYIRLRMCAATASIDRIELHASLTNWMWDSRNRFVSSWQFRCFLGLITSKSEAIAFTGAFNGNQWRKIKLGSFASIWKKDQTINWSWIWKKSSHEEGAHGGKLTVRKTCSKCPQCSLFSLFISLVVIFAFNSGEVIEDKFFLRSFFDWNATATKFLGNLQKGFA